jgi:hypothetical protein
VRHVDKSLCDEVADLALTLPRSVHREQRGTQRFRRNFSCSDGQMMTFTLMT